MAKTKIRETVEMLKSRLEGMLVVNGYATDLGASILDNQGRVTQSSDINTDTINIVDEGIEWDIQNRSLQRVHTIVCQFFVVSNTGSTLHDKIYDGLEDIEKMLEGMIAISIGSEKSAAIRITRPKANAWPHAENRDIALIELSLQFTYNIHTN
jgi:hypothetical protein